MKTAPVFILIDGEVDGPHEAAGILERMAGGYDDNDTPIASLPESTLSCIEGMKGWRTLPETLIYAYAKLLPALPQAGDWIAKSADGKLNLQDGNMTIRKTLLRTAKLDDLNAPEYLWPAIDANARLLVSWRDYSQRAQHWDKRTLIYYPLMEFVPFEKSRDWQSDWTAAGGQICHGRLIARKDDPCWKKFSDFNLPIPPFYFGREGYTADIGIEEANKLGCTINTEPIDLPPLEPFKIVGL